MYYNAMEPQKLCRKGFLRISETYLSGIFVECYVLRKRNVLSCYPYHKPPLMKVNFREVLGHLKMKGKMFCVRYKQILE